MLSVDHEYVVVYAQNRSPLRGRVIDRSDFSNSDNDPRGAWVSDPLTGKATAVERPNLHYLIVNPESGDQYPPDPARGWITDKAGFKLLLEQDRIVWPPSSRSGKPRKKRFLSETEERAPASSFWTDIKGQSGADEVDQILGERLFAFPKSLEFMSRILDLGLGHNDVVLDSTAGSGTTAHAVLAMNKEDGGKRKFVLVQMPHDNKDHEHAGINICEEITTERVRRVIKGYKAAGRGGESKVVAGLGGSFSYARVGPPILGETRSWGETLPAYEDLARYIYYTETSREFDPRGMNRTSGKIGEHVGASYYLLYTPDAQESKALDRTFVEGLRKDKNPRKVVYCEKVWIFRDELASLRPEVGEVRPMLLPFQVK